MPDFILHLERNLHIRSRSVLQIVLLMVMALCISACGSEQEVTTIASGIAAQPTIATGLVSSGITTPSTTVSTTTVRPVTSPDAGLGAKSPLPQDWKYRWLKGIPCQPPCWEGIIPGKTSAKDAVEILKQSPLVIDPKIFSPLSGTQYGYVIWHPAGMDSSIQGNLFFNAQTSDQIIYLIWPFLPDYKLSEIIKAYGEPSHVAAGYDTHQGTISSYHIYLVYLSKGFIISTAEHTSTIPVINSDLMLESPKFFIPNENELEKIDPVWLSKSMLVPWQGFKDFRFYCREPANSDKAENCNKALGSF